MPNKPFNSSLLDNLFIGSLKIVILGSVMSKAKKTEAEKKKSITITKRRRKKPKKSRSSAVAEKLWDAPFVMDRIKTVKFAFLHWNHNARH
jgi:hypothetical protein